MMPNIFLLAASLLVSAAQPPAEPLESAAAGVKGASSGASATAPMTPLKPRQPKPEQTGPCGVSGCLSPVEAVTYADYLAPKGGVAGIFEMKVQAVGLRDGRVFLNSESDYRDRNNLTIAINAETARALMGGTAVTEAAVRQKFIGKRAFVRGVAQRVRIGIRDDDGKATDLYYYQVQIQVRDVQQLRLFAA